MYRPFFVRMYPLHVHFHRFFVDRLLKRIEDQFDLVHLHSPLVAPVQTKRPVVSTIHNPLKVDIRYVELVDAFSLALRLQLPFSHHLERGVIKQSRAITTVSASVAEELREYGLDPGQISVIGTGVDVSLFEPATVKIPSQNPYILCVGRLAYRKGLSDLIEAMRLLSGTLKTKLVLVGSGPLEQRLRRQVIRYGLQDRVEFYGQINNKQKLAEVYRGALVYVQPSWYEGLPVTILEAAASGVPVIATSVSGNVEVIESGENGMLVPARAPSELAKAIAQLSEQPDQRRKFANAGLEVVHGRFTWDKVIDRTLAVYERVLDGS